ncbi:MAG: Lrp/AsnC family transcriptional regulator [Candidatus Thorarchaeota archaeon]|nr:MAG: Lrp/AsnC family transcriptional regulator [Candidatus Thorarchaeota archaeon]
MTVVNILVQTANGKQWTVSHKMRRLEGVEKSHVVSGTYDIIALAHVAERDLGRLLAQIHDLPGVVETELCVAL